MSEVLACQITAVFYVCMFFMELSCAQRPICCIFVFLPKSTHGHMSVNDFVTSCSGALYVLIMTRSQAQGVPLRCIYCPRDPKIPT